MAAPAAQNAQKTSSPAAENNPSLHFFFIAKSLLQSSVVFGQAARGSENSSDQPTLGKIQKISCSAAEERG